MDASGIDSSLQVFVWCCAALSALSFGAVILGRGHRSWPVTVLLLVLIACGPTVAFLALSVGMLPPVQRVATITAALAMLYALLAMFVARRDDDAFVRTRDVNLAAALLVGSVAGAVQAIVLATRIVRVAIDLNLGYPWPDPRSWGFSVQGLWSLGFLWVAVWASRRAREDSRLVVLQLASTMLIVTWACLVPPTYRVTPTGRFEQLPGTLLLMALLAIAFTGSMGLIRRTHSRSLWAALREDPDGLASFRPQYPGLSLAGGMLSLGCLLLVVYHLLVPVPIVSGGGYALTSIAVTVAAGVAALGAFLSIHREWDPYLADLALGLLSLAFAAGFTLFVPDAGDSLAARYPMLFNAIMVGLGFASALCGWLAIVWTQQRGEDGPWTTAGRLIPFMKRFAFLTAALALFVAALMTFWPTLPSVSVSDDSVGRVIAGVGAHVFLLGVVLWNARRLQRLTLHLLSVLTAVGLFAFVISRVFPYTSAIN